MTLTVSFATVAEAPVPVAGSCSSGTIILASRSAAGADIRLAFTRCPAKPPPAHLDVSNEDRAGDGGHTDRHGREEFRIRHAVDVGLDDQAGLNHLNKYIGDGCEALGSREAHRS